MNAGRTFLRGFLPGEHIDAPGIGFGYVIVPSREMLDLAHADDDVPVAWACGGETWIAPGFITRR